MNEPEGPPSLSVRTATAASWILSWRMTTRLLGLVNTIVLVRLLTPADFGLIALAVSLAQIVESLSSMGVSDALMREKKADRELYSTGFTINLIRGLLIAAVIAAEAAPIAIFFEDVRLESILFVLAAMMLLASLENVGMVEFRRNLSFEKDFQMAVVPRLLAIVVSIGCALVFRNYWALVAGILTNRILRVAMSYWLHPFRPSLTLRAWRRVAGFSFWNWMNVVVTTVRDRIDTVVIGRVYGSASVGLYSVGYEIGTLLATELVEPVSSALYAGFSAGQRGGSDVSKGYFRAVCATFLVTLPLGAGLAILASPVIYLLFGEKWMLAVPLVQVFAVAYMLRVITYFSVGVLNALGMIKITFRILLLSVIVRATLLAAMVVPFGLLGAAYAAAVSIAVEETCFMIFTFRRLGLKYADLVRGTCRCVIATAAMATVLMWFGAGSSAVTSGPLAALWDVLTAVLLGATTYCSTTLGLWAAAGRPSGAETAFLSVCGNTLRHFTRRWNATT